MDDLSPLTLDEQFVFLLHKKIMHKTATAKRQAKSYYQKQYQQTGMIPKPLLLAGQGILEGRKCSGRSRSLNDDIVKRFTQMVIASCDENDPCFIFVSQKSRKIKNYHIWLEQEFGSISLDALYRVVKRENLTRYLTREDFEKSEQPQSYFNPVNVFELVQVDGCQFQSFKIRDPQGQWRKPKVIEFYDTGSRYLFCMDFYFSENSENALKQFSKFLLSSAFVHQKIRIRPDNSKAFLNLKRPMQHLNQHYSDSSDGFFIQADYTGVCAPKHKVHLETSHRSLHNFEARIIKHFEDKIIETQPGFIFKGNKKIKIRVTLLDVSIEQLRNSSMLELYIKEHNENKHHFSHQGITQAWIPQQVFRDFLVGKKTFKFQPEELEKLMIYGLDKVKAMVSKKALITYNKRQYCVVVGREKFSTHQSTRVIISYYQNKLFIFEDKPDGILLAEAHAKAPSKIPQALKINTDMSLDNEFEQIAHYLNSQAMDVNIQNLIMKYQQGLTLEKTKQIINNNQPRYELYRKKTHLPDKQLRMALFNVFLIDCDRYQPKHSLPPYAKAKEL